MIQSKTQENELYDPNLTLKGWSGQKSDWLIRFLAHDFLIAPYTSQTSKSNSKGDMKSKPHFGHFWGPKIMKDRPGGQNNH